METVFEFKYNPDTFESVAITVSIHKTRKGAEMALDFHKLEQKKYIDEMYKDDPEDKPSIDKYQWWDVVETEVLD